jgi:hypothetical protein
MERSRKPYVWKERPRLIGSDSFRREMYEVNAESQSKVEALSNAQVLSMTSCCFLEPLADTKSFLKRKLFVSEYDKHTACGRPLEEWLEVNVGVRTQRIFRENDEPRSWASSHGP